MELGTIFYEKDYSNACDYTAQQGYTIKEIEADTFGRRFKIVKIPAPTEKELAQQEIQELTEWFDIYYARKEQKLRRLKELDILDDDGIDGQSKLIALYIEAEDKRKRIKELEKEINNEN